MVAGVAILIIDLTLLYIIPLISGTGIIVIFEIQRINDQNINIGTSGVRTITVGNNNATKVTNKILKYYD